MRITQRAVALTSLQGLGRNLDAVARLQEQLTSGRMINKPSDSPTGTNQALQTRSDIAATAQYARNITDGKTQLEATDSALTTMLDQVRRVRDLTVQASNTGALGLSSQKAIAAEIDQLQRSLLDLANQKLQGHPLFGGITQGTQAFDTAGDYVGSPKTGPQVMRRVSDTERVRVNITGEEAFVIRDAVGLDKSLFAVVADISAAIKATSVDSAALANGLGDLDAVRDTMLSALADVGARSKRVEIAQQITADRSLTLGSRLAETENIDLPKTIMELEMQKVGYEAALSATAKALQPTLVDFLR
ncbi:flagellar hook-associated protein FlgL [Geodermatophilus ruber]|uniref:Flagellar hook-associated protein 3 FlgL n=1 Tax=Geodermatophilus ruber TaxID=504800 RepID=A0A1I4FZY5_9ACTN|nr:flagellar hook-associated protein FlgL [Geodermatophilus ruber]SFL23334.1 flagellar hook-associated protein 3 FlgL [Geodermatophilus ruber]